MKNKFGFLAIACAFALSANVQAQEITLRLEHFAPPVSTAQKEVFEPWCERLKTQSGGRVKCQIYPSMQLGGTPAQLVDHVKNGIADIVWTAPSFSAGRFPLVEALELPFLVTNPSTSNKLAWEYYTKHAYKDFEQFKLIAIQLDPALIHLKDKEPGSLAELKGLRIRAAHRLGAKSVSSFGAVPVTMPVPLVVDALSKGVLDGTVSSWEQVHANKIDEVARTHLVPPAGKPYFSGSVLVVLMNKQKFASLPPDVQALIEKNSGQALTEQFGRVWDTAVKANMEFAQKQKDKFISLPVSEYTVLMNQAREVDDQWIKDISSKGIDGKALIDELRQNARKQ